MNKTDLALVSTGEMIDELEKRFDGFVVCGVQFRGGKDGDKSTWRHWKGDHTLCAGLLSHFQIAIYDTMCQKADEDEDDRPFEI